MCHWLDINFTFSTSVFYMILSHDQCNSLKNVNLSFIYWNMRCTVHGFHSFYRCISTCLKCTWTLLPLPLWACQPVKELFRSPTWMLLWDLWRNMLQKSTLARYVFKWINVMLVFQVWISFKSLQYYNGSIPEAFSAELLLTAICKIFLYL